MQNEEGDTERAQEVETKAEQRQRGIERAMNDRHLLVWEVCNVGCWVPFWKYTIPQYDITSQIDTVNNRARTRCAKRHAPGDMHKLVKEVIVETHGHMHPYKHH